MNACAESYPSHLIDVWRARTGERFVLRPVVPMDHEPLNAMFLRLSRGSSYNRFHGAVRGLPEQALYAMTRVDYRRHLALVAVVADADAPRDLIVAEARYVADPAHERAEFAIVVDDPWQRLGLAARALRVLAAAARRQGLRRLHGSVLATNTPMLRFAQHVGFACSSDPAECRLLRLRASLADFMTQQEAVAT